MRYTVNFERIGRNHSVDAIEVGDNPDAIAIAVWKLAKTKLASHDFQVDVDIDNLKGSIEGGRFGTFTLTEIP